MTIRPLKPTGTAIVTDAGRRLGIIRRGTAGMIPGTMTLGTTGAIPGTIAAGMVAGTTLGMAMAGIHPGDTAIAAIMAIITAGMAEVGTIAVPADVHGAGLERRIIGTCRGYAAVRTARTITRWGAIAAAPILIRRALLTAHQTPVWAARAPVDGRVAEAPLEAVAARAVVEAAPWEADTRMEAEDNLVL